MNIALEEHFIVPCLIDYLEKAMPKVSPAAHDKLLAELADFGEMRISAIDAGGVSLAKDPNHDAIMRIESEAPRWRLHSSQRRKVHVGLRRPPPRIGIGPGRCRFEPQEMCRCLPSSYAAGRNITPSGISPVFTMRHSAMSSLRASATIIVLRVPLRPSAARVRNH